MKAFPENKVLRRVIKIKSSDRAIADAQWVLELGVFGVRIHRLNHRSEQWSLSWRSVISHALVHGAGRTCPTLKKEGAK